MHITNHDQIPAFKPSLRVDALDDDTLVLLCASRRLLLHGRMVVQVALAIDGQRSVARIITLLGNVLPAEDVLYVLAQLSAKGHLDMGDSTLAPSVQAWWELLGADVGAAAPALGTLTVSVDSVGGLATDRLKATLAAAGVACNANEATLHVVLTDDYLRSELQERVAQAATAGVPVLLVRPVGATPAIGPLIDAGDGSCLTCLQFWTRSNHPVEALLARRTANACHLPLALAAPAEQAIYGMVAVALATMAGLPTQKANLQRHVLTLELGTLETRRHAVTRRPQCPHCGDPALQRRRAHAAPALQRVTGLHREYGGYRQCDPGTTFARYQHLVSPLTGPVSYLHPMPGRHQGIRKVYVAGYMVTPQEDVRSNSFDRVCAGKGQTDEQARASALCEALERYSGVYQGDEARVRTSMAALGEGQAIHFNDLQHFSQAQFAQRDRINAATADRRRQVPERFEVTSVIDWTPAWSLASGRMRYVPFTYCYAEAPPDAGARFGIHNPNGAAAGNCLEEAVLQGLLELIERDACAIWWYNQLGLPALDLDAVDDPYVSQLRREYARLGWDLWVLDLTHDLGIPVYAALAHHSQQQRFALGFGCHLDGQLALQRALTELNQLFDPSGTSPAPWDADLLGDSSWLFPTNRAGGPAKVMPRLGGTDLKSDIDYCVALLARHGMDTLIVDKTRPDIGLHVAQVIVPGLRHFWPRFGQGRLYAVPPALGWLAQATTEEGLNRAPLFL